MTKVTSAELTVDEQFKRLIPPLSEEEYALLAKSISDEGLREPIITWNDVIVDGHNRYQICRDLEIPIRTVERSFKDRKEACQWILENQLGRRNLSGVQASYLRGSLYKSMRHPNHVHRKKGSAHGHTQELLADQFCVSVSTIRVDVGVADAVESLCEPAREFVLSPKSIVHKQNIFDLSYLSHESQRLVVEKVQAGEVDGLQKAIFKLRPKAVNGLRQIRCKKCGAKLAAGIVTCLACDLTDRDVRDAFSANQNTPPEVDDSWKERLAELQAEKRGSLEIEQHVNWLVDYIEHASIVRNSSSHMLLAKLYRVMRLKLGKGRFGDKKAPGRPIKGGSNV